MNLCGATAEERCSVVTHPRPSVSNRNLCFKKKKLQRVACAAYKEETMLAWRAMEALYGRGYQLHGASDNILDFTAGAADI